MKEIKEIAKYISEYGIKAKTRAQMFPKYQIDMRCCFIDDLTKTCMIYPVRPDICKSFICNQSMIDIHHNKMKILSRPGVYNVSMHVTFLRDSMFIEYISGNPVLREILTDIQIEW
jgi:Fe-S-cluster containining protein